MIITGLISVMKRADPKSKKQCILDVKEFCK
jgi:hypothetical protein